MRNAMILVVVLCGCAPVDVGHGDGGVQTGDAPLVTPTCVGGDPVCPEGLTPGCGGWLYLRIFPDSEARECVMQAPICQRGEAVCTGGVPYCAGRQTVYWNEGPPPGIARQGYCPEL